MKFKVTSQIKYEVQTDSTFILNVHALRTHHQAVITEAFAIDPYFKSEELILTGSENRFVRLEVPGGNQINVTYEATVDNAFKLIDCTELTDISINHLPADVLIYLNPSRYCQSDKLYRFANNNFGSIDNPFKKVQAIADWIYQNVEYICGASNSQTSAYDTVTEQAGVCRDFAHLAIALCRACSIPARYFTGYAYQLNPPDFHACFEAFLGSEWILFDATRLSPLNGLVKIATGRDAADTAIASIFGEVNCTFISVNCNLIEDSSFIPFFYNSDDCKGVSCL